MHHSVKTVSSVFLSPFCNPRAPISPLFLLIPPTVCSTSISMSGSDDPQLAPNSPAIPTVAAAPLPFASPPPSVPRDSFQHVRFSAEDSPDDAPLAGETGGGAGSRGGLEAIAAPARRHQRGRSLRHQLFHRRTRDTFQNPEDLLGAHGGSSNSVKLGRLGDDSQASSKDRHALFRDPPHPRQRRSTSGWLHRRFAPAWHRLVAFGVNLKKTILRAHELPPSKGGRRIPLDVRRIALLVDGRTGNHYVNNTVGASHPFGLVSNVDADKLRYAAAVTLCGISSQNSFSLSFRGLRTCQFRY